MAARGLVYVILVNWNGWADTAECVESCAKLEGVDFRLVVVDNDSSNDSVEQLARRFPELRIVESGSNLGFAGGNNVGIELAIAEGADFVWLLNNDTTVAPDALAELVGAAEQDPSAGMFGSKVFYYSRPDVIWFAGGELQRKAGYPRHIGADQVDDGRFDSVEPVEFLSGCSLLVRREVVEKVGPLFVDYFMYWEDVDWCERARSAGWDCLYVPTSRVWHKVSASLRETGHLDLRYETRNRLRFYWTYRRARASGVLFWTLRDIAVLALKGRFRNAGARLAGVVDFAAGRRGMIRRASSA